MKVIVTEPAERPYTVALSTAEVLALSNWHATRAKRIASKAGSVTIRLMAERKPSRDVKAALDAAKQLLDAHTTRAKGLYAIIK